MLMRDGSLTNEDGTTVWARMARPIYEQTGSIDVLTPRYKRIVAALGEVGTEIGRSKTVRGEVTEATIQSAAHSFIFPPQEAVILRSDSGDRDEYSQNGETITREHKRAAVEPSYIDANIGVILDSTAQPPELKVYDLINPSRVDESLKAVLESFVS